MARARRRFGTISVKTSPRSSRKYIEAKYKPPVEAYYKWPGMLPEYYTKRFAEGFETEAEKWLNDADVFEAFVPVRWVEDTTAEDDLPAHDETKHDPHEHENEQVNDSNEQEDEQEKAPSRGQLLLNLIRTNPSITYHEAADALNVSYSTARRAFQTLREFGIIERIGSGRRGTWRILTPPQPSHK
ncbi:DNA integration/recombination/inversion protein [Bifidobacterium sp. DSM 109959]|uniref:DNA integration/recombination/inversion protein n=2 Tax=Bifidobacterium olomucense TaxID=2675324 RepID=A0A7Y0EY44_9BIFI|nr:DNA integration/recombination/inversion protein [Bifidobacterium sp. DSM 109959]